MHIPFLLFSLFVPSKTEGSNSNRKSWSNNMNDSDSDNNSGNDNDNDHHHQLQEEEEEEEEYDIIVDKLIPILQRKGAFSLRTRYKINELAREFLENLGNDIHEMLCDDDVEDDDYFGLDSDRDTEAEVETALRFFPELLTRRKKDAYVNDYGYRVVSDGFYPIELLAYTRSGSNIWKCNLKAVSFIPLVVRLSIEFDLFEENERGGLLFGDEDDDNMLKLLSSTGTMVASDRENHELVDDTYLNVMIQLRQMGHIKKEDIYIHGLLMRMCNQSIFPGERFQFLVEWYPIALIRPDMAGGYFPLHRAAIMSSIQAFQTIFEYGIRYYPKKKGISLLFMKDNNGRTPIQIAFRKTKLRDKVMTVIEDTPTRYSSSSSSSDNNSTSINTIEALVMAAIDENIHLDCVYFLLRRQPDVLVKLPSSTSTPTPTPGEAAGSNNNNNNNEDDDGNDDGGDERNDGKNDIFDRRTLYSNQKRKREL
jgi:hypothetical protein